VNNNKLKFEHLLKNDDSNRTGSPARDRVDHKNRTSTIQNQNVKNRSAWSCDKTNVSCFRV